MKSILTLVKLLTCSLVILLSNTTSKACILCNWFGGWSCVYVSGSTCGELGIGNGAYSNLGTTYCENYLAMPSPNSSSALYVDLSNKAVLDINGKIVKVASDKLELLVTTRMKNSREPLNNKELIGFMKDDNGFVSKSSLEEIARTFHIKIIKVNKLPEANYCKPCKDNNKNGRN